MAEYISDAAKKLTMSYYEPQAMFEALVRNGFELVNFRDQETSFMVVAIAI
jgi:hypothetical protein